MNPSLTPTFVEAFTQTCFDAGLDKESTARLLQNESVKQVGQRYPAFEEGYRKVADTIPGGLRPRFTEEGMQKMAMPLFRAAGSGLRWLGRGVARFPRTAALGGAGAAGLGAWQLNKALNRDRDLLFPGAPFMGGPGGYDASAAAKNYEDLLYGHYGPGIAAHNKDYGGSFSRRRALEKAVAENAPGSGDAMRELRRLNQQRAQAEAQRQAYFEQLDSSHDVTQGMLERIKQRQQQLSSPNWFQKQFLKLQGKNPTSQIESLQDSAARAQTALRLIKDQRRLLAEDYRGVRPTKPMTQTDVQEKFFPSYDN